MTNVPPKQPDLLLVPWALEELLADVSKSNEPDVLASRAEMGGRPDNGSIGSGPSSLNSMCCGSAVRARSTASKRDYDNGRRG